MDDVYDGLEEAGNVMIEMEVNDPYEDWDTDTAAFENHDNNYEG